MATKRREMPQYDKAEYEYVGWHRKKLTKPEGERILWHTLEHLKQYGNSETSMKEFDFICDAMIDVMKRIKDINGTCPLCVWPEVDKLLRTIFPIDKTRG